jgi:hypothetical protein
LSGIGVYKRLMRNNDWAARYLPAASSAHCHGDDPRRQARLQSIAERILRHRALDRWERWEMERLQAKLRPQIGEAAEVVCTLHQCKGHTGLHRQSVLSRFSERAKDLGVPALLPELGLMDLDHATQES